MSSLVVIPSRLWEYCIAAVIIILAPGPSVLFVIARAIAWGRATAIATVAGNVMGAFSLSVVVAVGLGPILQRSELAFTSVQVLGGGYLVYLGISAIKHSQIHASDMTNQGDIRPSKWKSIREGYWVGALNPKGIVFFAAILPQFVDREAGGVTSQLILMGAIFGIFAFFSDGGWGILAGTIRNWLATEMIRLVRMRMAGGIVMILLGIFTLISAIPRK
ncbi:MAG: LysE family translocator [Actinobacteria bacterium]|nr:LysE family translocator [Actinomycetota bacterium]MSW22091.1 LysE family translocator [Actinomycetota bacterium]MSX03389.1 LysE family translocator [Actinomycetota bacterium]MSX83664.1 LysE family translocator [Actinomycetota bacterium]MSY96109.1 LysE family translocator [Actinomycetota bacterium]